jgi:hypothetical protein
MWTSLPVINIRPSGHNALLYFLRPAICENLNSTSNNNLPKVCRFVFFFLAVLGLERRTYTLSYSSPFLWSVFSRQGLINYCPGWLWMESLLISASGVARISGRRHQCLDQKFAFWLQPITWLTGMAFQEIQYHVGLQSQVGGGPQHASTLQVKVCLRSLSVGPLFSVLCMCCYVTEQYVQGCLPLC